MTENTSDKGLTRAYRDLATESTPPELDDRVLRMAAREARSRYGIARSWVRPVAWAATIGLSLAIVLEVTQVIPPAAESVPATGIEATPEPLPADESAARQEQAPAGRQDTAEIPAAIGATARSAPANPGGGGAEELGARRALVQDPREVQESRSVEADDADAFAAKDIRILEEAEMRARQHAGAPSVAVFSAVPGEAMTAHCDETARETAESWYACIEALREADNAEFAAIELDALRQAFPDFEVPAPGK